MAADSHVDSHPPALVLRCIVALFPLQPSDELIESSRRDPARTTDLHRPEPAGGHQLVELGPSEPQRLASLLEGQQQAVGRNVFVLSEGKLKLFTLGWCGSSPCIPYWELFGMPASGAVVADGTSQVFVLGGGRVFAVSATTPEMLWSASTSATTLALAGDVVYTVGLDPLGRMVLETWPRSGCGLPLCSRTSRTVLGPTTGSQPISPVVAGGVVYVADGSLVRALDISGCTNTVCAPRLLATIQAPGGRITGMTVDAGHLLLASVGTIEAFAPA